MDLRVNMVRTCLQERYLCGRFPSGTEGFPHPFFRCPYVQQPSLPMPCERQPLPRQQEYPGKSSRRRLVAISSEVKARNGFIESDRRIMKLVHVIFDILCVRGYDRAVIMVYRIRELIALIRNTGIEDKLHIHVSDSHVTCPWASLAG